MTTQRSGFSRVLALSFIGIQTACDVGSGPVSLTMSIDPTSITLGESATITWEWKTPEGGFCDARGAWRGNRKSRGSKVVTPAETGTLSYGLECFEDFDSTHHRSRTASVTLTVNAPAAFTHGALSQPMAAEYVFETIDFPGADRTEAYGINNAGQIVGHYFDAAGQHGFIKDGDSYVVLDVGTQGSSAFGINDVPQIVGTDSAQGFLKDGDLVELIAVPSSYFTSAWDIDNSGRVVGAFNDDFGTHGFVKDGDAFVSIDVPEALFTQATGINDDGDIVGNYIDSGAVFRAFQASDGLTSEIQVPGALIVEARDIDNSGRVVGSFVDADGVVHGFVRAQSGISVLDVPGAASPNFTQAKGINDSGSVVGWYDEGGGRVHGFLAMPSNTTSVTIDIAPGNSNNALDPHSSRLIWVAILSETAAAREFDSVAQIDASTVEFGPAGAEHIQHEVRDINRDGLADLVLQFRVSEAGLRCGATHATVTGAMFGGQSFTGTDQILTIGCE